MTSLPAAAGDLAQKHPKIWNAYAARRCPMRDRLICARAD